MNKLWDCPTCGRAGFDRTLGRCLYCSDTIPRLLTARDPRNANHVAAALELMPPLNGFTILEQTSAEIRALGLPMPKNTKVAKKVESANVAIGMPFLLEQGLILPGNVIMTCQTCHAPVQYRPALAHTPAIHLCPFCAVDRALRDYWNEAKPPSP